MEAKKVGILTMFYNSKNYGGCLQAFALVKYLRDRGVDAEQINYRAQRSSTADLKRLSRLSPAVLWEKLRRRLKRLFKKRIKTDAAFEQALRQREAVFSEFRKTYVPSSETVYTNETIGETASRYNAFVVGSDQVWNEVTENSPYLLGFVPNGVAKISYAASVAQDELSDYAKQTFKNALTDYRAVSVREKEMASLLSEVTGRKAEWVLDPTLLLNPEEWESLCEPVDIPTPYLFCYFLGDDSRERQLAAAYAEKHGLKIVTLPYLQGTPRACDTDFGDYRLWDISPFQFLWLIKNASCVFADSLHACVFSCMFQKNLFACKRVEGHTNSRLSNLLSLFGLENRFLTEPEHYCLEHLETVPTPDYTTPTQVAQLKESSEQYLKTYVMAEFSK